MTLRARGARLWGLAQGAGYWLRTHTVKDKLVIVVALVGAVGAVLLSFFDTETTTSPLRIVIAAVCAVLLSSSLFFPVAGASIAFILALIFSGTNYASSSSWLAIDVTSMFIVGLVNERPTIKVLPFFAVIFFCTIDIIFDKPSIVGLALYAFMFLGPWAAGVLIRQQRELHSKLQVAHQLEMENALLKQQQRDIRLARDIHDSVTNELSYIILLSSGNNSNNGEASLTASQQQFISDKAKAALNRVHLIISLLDGKTSAQQVQSAEAPSSFMEVVRALCQKQDEALLQAGYQGASRVSGDGKEPPELVVSAIRHVLVEVYANIARHCEPDVDQYTVVVACTEEAVTVFQTNTCLHGVHQVADVSHGKGLALQQQTVEGLGGSLNTSFEDGTWILNCAIPLP